MTPNIAKRVGVLLADRLPERADGHYTINHVKRFMRGWRLPRKLRYASYLTVFSQAEKRRLATSPLPAPLDEPDDTVGGDLWRGPSASTSTSTYPMTS